MPLPKIELIRYPVKIPSLNKQIEFRPFNVREQKELMIAQESNDNAVKIKGVCRLIESCTEGMIPDATKLKMYDIEYLLLKIRAKSVGEISSISVKCENEKCGCSLPINLNLEKIEVYQPDIKISPKIQLTKDVWIELKEPTVEDFIHIIESDKPEEILSICRAIKKIYDKEKVYDDFTEDELIEFIENLSSNSMTSIQEFFESMPSIKHVEYVKCSKCNAETEVIIEGLSNFFE